MSIVRVVALVVLGALPSLAVGHWVTRWFPNSGDEYSYLLQAEIFAEGRLSVESAPESVREAFALDHVVDDGRVRSKYPPGWPAILALGVMAGSPWLVSVLLALGSVVLVYWLTRDLAGELAGWAGAIFLGTSPMFFFNGGGYFSHLPALFLATACVRCLLWQTSSPVIGGLGAAFGGALFLTRPLDAVLLAVAILASLRIRDFRVKYVWWAGIGTAIASLYLAYNAIQFGAPWVTGYAAYEPAFERLYGATQSGPDLDLSHIAYVRQHLVWMGELVQWTSPAIVAAPLAVIAFGQETSPVVRGCWVLIAAVVLSAQLLKADDGDGYGPRYLYLMLLPLAHLVGVGVTALWERLQRRLVAGLCLLICSISIVAFATQQGRAVLREVKHRSRLFLLVEKAHLSDAVVLVRDADAYGPNWYTRNGTRYSRSVIFATDLGHDVYKRLRDAYPERRFYLYRSPTTGARATLAPLSSD